MWGLRSRHHNHSHHHHYSQQVFSRGQTIAFAVLYACLIGLNAYSLGAADFVARAIANSTAAQTRQVEYLLSAQTYQLAEVNYSYGVSLCTLLLLLISAVWPILAMRWLRSRALAIHRQGDSNLIKHQYQSAAKEIEGFAISTWMLSAYVFHTYTDVLSSLPDVPLSVFRWILFFYTLAFLLPPLSVLWVLKHIAYPVYALMDIFEGSLEDFVERYRRAVFRFVLPGATFVLITPFLSETDLFHIVLMLIVVVIVSAVLMTGYLRSLSDENELQTLSSGALYERILQLSESLGVQIHAVYCFSDNAPELLYANSLAFGISRYLLTYCTKSEIDALVARKIALTHKKKRWMTHQDDRRADIRAVEATQNPTAMITALLKMARIQQSPLRWGLYGTSVLTDAYVRRRIEAIAQRYHISAQALDTLISEAFASVNPEDCYLAQQATIL